MPNNTKPGSRAKGVGSITSSMKKVTITAGPSGSRQRSRSRRRSSGGGGGGSNGQGRRRSRSRSRSAGRGSSGGFFSPMEVFKLAKEELCQEVTATADGVGAVYMIHPIEKGTTSAALGTSYLARLAQVFERMRWLYFELEYIPEVGSTVGGSVSIGVDWDLTATVPKTHADVTVHSPMFFQTVWKNRSMRLNLSKATNNRWFVTAKSGASTGASGTAWLDVAPANIVVFATSTSSKVGYLRVKYTVEFEGTKSN